MATPSDLAMVAPEVKDGKVMTCPLPGARVAYLTFDDGVHGSLVDMAKLLLSRNITATFFPVSKFYKEKQYVEAWRTVRDLGHDIGGHTFGHADLGASQPFDWKRQIERADELFREALGEEMRLFRPPYGRQNRMNAETLRTKYRYTSFGWSMDSKDATVQDREIIYATLRRMAFSAQGGDILLFHTDRWAGPKKLAKALDILQSKCTDCRWLGLSECLKRGSLPAFALPPPLSLDDQIASTTLLMGSSTEPITLEVTSRTGRIAPLQNASMVQPSSIAARPADGISNALMAAMVPLCLAAWCALQHCCCRRCLTMKTRLATSVLMASCWATLLVIFYAGKVYPAG